MDGAGRAWSRRGVLLGSLVAGAALTGLPAGPGRALASTGAPGRAPVPPPGPPVAPGPPAVPGPVGDGLAHAEGVPAPYIARCFEWGARPPSSPPQIHDVRPIRILVHHTAGPNGTDYGVPAAHALARGIQRYHMDHNGWLDSGQHFTISRGGHVMEGRLWSLGELNRGRRVVEGAHSPGQNVIAIGIENEGTYTGATPTPMLWHSLRATCAYICDKYGIAPTELYGHRDFRDTLCPGDRLYAALPRLRREVASLMGRRVSRTEVVRSGWPALRGGDRGPAVEAAQYLLRDSGFYRGRPDGRYDARTGAAVTALQRAHRAGRPVCGACGADAGTGVLGGLSWPLLARPVRLGSAGVRGGRGAEGSGVPGGPGVPGDDVVRAVGVLAAARNTESVPDVVDGPAWQRLLSGPGTPVPGGGDPAGVANR
ncbi:peptidoglycan recognition protein family protein [Pseudonocardia phyllosphaerae]|uniref:peptidoglycan recognition protein family protein n=1 Tax=Pseudonocardia phyllosphaerae TaxID=3390502 RepID=UPI0039785F22